MTYGRAYGMFNSVYIDRYLSSRHFSWLVLTFKDRFTNVCQELAKFGLQEHEKRQAEINSFFSCVKEAITNNKNSCVECIDNFENYKKKVEYLHIHYCY